MKSTQSTYRAFGHGTSVSGYLQKKYLYCLRPMHVSFRIFTKKVPILPSANARQFQDIYKKSTYIAFGQCTSFSEYKKRPIFLLCKGAFLIKIFVFFIFIR